MLPSNTGSPGSLTLSGFDAPPQAPTDRLFFALFPDLESAARLAELAQRLRAGHGLAGKPFAAARLHVTLHLLGDYAGGLPQPVVDAACEAAAALSMPRPEVAFGRAASFMRKTRNRPFVLRDGPGEADGAAVLRAMQQALGAAMAAARLGRRPASAPGVPHMTLLYDDRCIAEHAVEPVGWTAHEFVLVHSLLGHSRYVPLARWPLGS